MFTLMHPERYASLDTYRSRTADCRELVRSMVSDGWTIGEDPGVWCHVESPETKVPDAGFKIHVSTRRETVRETLTAVVPILVDDGLTGAYSVFPTNFLGMTGFGNFFVDMYQHTGEHGYLEEARRFVDRIMLFAIEKPTGIVFPGEELIRLSTDYGTGSAGTGTFFHRIVAGGGIPYFDIP